MGNLNVIVPYRDRQEQKSIFIDGLHKFLCDSEVDSFRIYIVEQNDEKEFNKGCLLNIGFLETNIQKDDYYCFHDIDLLPKSSLATYNKPPENKIVHPYGHKHCLSNKILINPDTYIKLNGFSTKYWVWGFEDTDFQLRATYNQVEILRDNFSERFQSNTYLELDDQVFEDIDTKMNKISSKVNQILFYNTLLDLSCTHEEGLNTTEYKVLRKEELENYTIINCEIKNENKNLKYIQSLEKYGF